jgi:hypothetical protein
LAEAAQNTHPLLRGAVLRGKLHQYIPVSVAGGVARGKRQVYAPGWKADVVYDHRQLIGRNHAPYFLIHAREDLRRYFDARATRRTDVKL